MNEDLIHLQSDLGEQISKQVKLYNVGLSPKPNSRAPQGLCGRNPVHEIRWNSQNVKGQDGMIKIFKLVLFRENKIKN